MPVCCRSVSQDALKQVVHKVQQLEDAGELAGLQDEDFIDSILPPGYEAPAGSISAQREWPGMDAKELTLSNGMKVHSLHAQRAACLDCKHPDMCKQKQLSASLSSLSSSLRDGLELAADA